MLQAFAGWRQPLYLLLLGRSSSSILSVCVCPALLLLSARKGSSR
jgi:hypothetical protein